MRLHYHPVATTCRPLMLFAEEEGIELDYRLVDLCAGEQQRPTFAALNPNACVPVLQDGDFTLTESSAILKYLAEQVGSAAYPPNLRERARVNERMDWLNTFVMRDLCYGFVYPQIYSHHRRREENVQARTLEWARERARQWLGVLEEHLLGPRNDYLCGARVSLADYFGIALLTLGEAVRIDYSRWPNIERWMHSMKARPAFARTHEIFYTQIVAPRAAISFQPF